MAEAASLAPEQVLPETAEVPWRRRASAGQLRSYGGRWTAWTSLTVAHFSVTAAVLLAIEPLSAPVAVLCLVHAWVIPELYAKRGANVLLPVRDRRPRAERRALGLLGDLLDHEARDLQVATGLALEPGSLGIWLVGERGAVLVTPGGRRAHCFCVRVPDPELPPSDRIAHLLLALRTDELGFATVANHAFSGCPRRVRRRVRAQQRSALDAARSAARAPAG